GQIFSKGSARANTERLYALKQKMMVMKHAVFPLMEAVGKLYGGRVPQVCSNSQDYFRDVYDHLTRINSSIDTIRHTIQSPMQVHSSMVSIEDNAVAKCLAAWGGMFAVRAAVAGLAGMNFKHMRELEWHYGYPMALFTLAGA